MHTPNIQTLREQAQTSRLIRDHRASRPTDVEEMAARLTVEQYTVTKRGHFVCTACGAERTADYSAKMPWSHDTVAMVCRGTCTEASTRHRLLHVETIIEPVEVTS